MTKAQAMTDNASNLDFPTGYRGECLDIYQLAAANIICDSKSTAESANEAVTALDDDKIATKSFAPSRNTLIIQEAVNANVMK